MIRHHYDHMVLKYIFAQSFLSDQLGSVQVSKL